MSASLLDILTTTPLETLFLLLAINMLRMLGFLYGFVPMYWGLMQSTILRVNLAIALCLPVMAGNLAVVARLVNEATPLDLALLGPKEFAIGLGLGVLASTPFAAVSYAGAIIDTFRGESDSGIQGPTGGTIQTTPLLYMVIILAAFMNLDLFAQVFSLVYTSYEIWNVNELLPNFPQISGRRVGDFLANSLRIGLLVAMPVFLLLALCELAVIVAARLGRKMGLYDLAFVAKNLLMVLSLPLATAVLVMNSPEMMGLSVDALQRFLSLFNE